MTGPKLSDPPTIDEVEDHLHREMNRICEHFHHELHRALRPYQNQLAQIAMLRPGNVKWIKIGDDYKPYHDRKGERRGRGERRKG